MYSYKYYYIRIFRAPARAYLEIVKCNNKCVIDHIICGTSFHMNDFYFYSNVSICGIQYDITLKYEKNKIRLKYSEKGNIICCSIPCKLKELKYMLKIESK